MRTAERVVNRKKKQRGGFIKCSLYERLDKAKSFCCAEEGTLVITYDVKT